MVYLKRTLTGPACFFRSVPGVIPVLCEATLESANGPHCLLMPTSGPDPLTVRQMPTRSLSAEPEGCAVCAPAPRGVWLRAVGNAMVLSRSLDQSPRSRLRLIRGRTGAKCNQWLCLKTVKFLPFTCLTSPPSWIRSPMEKKSRKRLKHRCQGCREHCPLLPCCQPRVSRQRKHVPSPSRSAIKAPLEPTRATICLPWSVKLQA